MRRIVRRVRQLLPVMGIAFSSQAMVTPPPRRTVRSPRPRGRIISLWLDALERWLLAPGNHWRWLARALEAGFTALTLALLVSICMEHEHSRGNPGRALQSGNRTGASSANHNPEADAGTRIAHIAAATGGLPVFHTHMRVGTALPR